MCVVEETPQDSVLFKMNCKPKAMTAKHLENDEEHENVPAMSFGTSVPSYTVANVFLTSLFYTGILIAFLGTGGCFSNEAS